MKLVFGFDRFMRFAHDRRASMSTQVVIFSVMLFGASGVVLDFGRVYSEHTQMQAFTDQAALAAAAELDREPDSIDRAVAAVFGSGASAPFGRTATWSEGDGGAFGVEYLIFVDVLSADTGAQTSMGDLGAASSIYVHFADGADSGDKALAATAAKFVVAVAEERSVRNSLIQLINQVEEGAVASAQVVKTISAAKRKILSCGPRTNLVMCNPFEGSSTGFRAFFDETQDNDGVQFSSVANGALDQPDSIGVMAAPTSLGGVNAICDDPATLPGFVFGMTDDEVATLRTICHLSAAQPGPSCVQEEVAIVPASAEVVQTALSTAFDIWDDSMAEVLTWDMDAGGNRSIDPGFNPGTAHALRDSSPLFQPDVSIAKGRARKAAADIAANAAAGIPDSSRRNYTRTHQYFDLNLSACFRQSNPSFCQPGMNHVSVPYSFPEVLSYYISYWQDHFAFVGGGAIPSPNIDTAYKAYQEELSARWGHWEVTGQRLSHTPNSGIGDEVGDGEKEDAHLGIDTGAPFFTPQQNNLSNYTYELGALDTAERRRMSVTFVNCGGASTEADGTRIADVVGFADLFMIQPPRPFCADGTENCANASLASSRLFTEFITLTDVEETVYSVLVR